MNTLEDAFINIGMDEDRYLGETDSENKEKFTNFENIVPPPIIS